MSVFCAVLSASLIAIATAAISSPASADTPASNPGTPGVPGSTSVVAATSTSFTVALAAAANTSTYQVFVGRAQSDLYVANITSATKMAQASQPRITAAGLAYTSAPYYYRLKTLNSASHAWGTVIYAAGLTPAAPSGVHAVTGSIGTYLAWNPQTTGSGFWTTQATNAAMTQNAVSRVVTAGTYQYTPYNLTRGVRYYFQVRAKNVGTLSSAASTLTLVNASAQSGLRVLTYNVLQSNATGKSADGTTIASWAARRAGVAALIRQGNPDVAGIQEAAGWTTSVQGYGGVRQIDDLMKLLPGYALAMTEVPPTVHGYFRTGDYIIYKTSTYRAVGAGGHWTIGPGGYGIFQEMQSRATGAKFLFTTTHLTAGSGASYDTERENETKSLYSQAAKVAGADHVRVVWTGDFNSDINSGHAFDGPGIAMSATHNSDAKAVAVYHYNPQYDSANQYLRTPPAFGQNIDYVYVGPGISVLSWGIIVNLKAGRFVGTIPSDHSPVWATITIGY